MIRQGCVDRLLSLGRELDNGGGVQLRVRKSWGAWEENKGFPGPCRACPFWISGPCWKLPWLSGIGDPGAGQSWEHQGVSEFFSLLWCVLTSRAFYVHTPGNSSWWFRYSLRWYMFSLPCSSLPSEPLVMESLTSAFLLTVCSRKFRLFLCFSSKFFYPLPTSWFQGYFHIFRYYSSVPLPGDKITLIQKMY